MARKYPTEQDVLPNISEYCESDDDDDDDDDSDGDDNDDDYDDVSDDEEEENESQSKQNMRMPGNSQGGVLSMDDTQDSNKKLKDEDQSFTAASSKSRWKGFGKKFRFSLSGKKKHKPDPSSEAAFQKLRAKIADLENEKAVAQSKMDQMQLEMCNETEAFIKERDGLQAEVTQLRLLIEDLMTQVEQAESELEKAKENQNISSSIELCQARGWLWKRGVKGPTGRMWRRRWFITESDGRLYYYRKNNYKIPRGCIDIDKITEVQDLPPSPDETNEDLAFFNVVTPGRTYEMMARGKEEKTRWINALDHLMYWTKRKASCHEGQATCNEGEEFRNEDL